MGAKDSKPCCITYEEAVRRGWYIKSYLNKPSARTVKLARQQINYSSFEIHIHYGITCFITVTDAELKRLKEAFKRVSTLNGCITKQSFIKDVLGEGVPTPVAEV